MMSDVRVRGSPSRQPPIGWTAPVSLRARIDAGIKTVRPIPLSTTTRHKTSIPAHHHLVASLALRMNSGRHIGIPQGQSPARLSNLAWSSG
jgi:hypothetical protein